MDNEFIVSLEKELDTNKKALKQLQLKVNKKENKLNFIKNILSNHSYLDVIPCSSKESFLFAFKNNEDFFNYFKDEKIQFIMSWDGDRYGVIRIKISFFKKIKHEKDYIKIYFLNTTDPIFDENKDSVIQKYHNIIKYDNVEHIIPNIDFSFLSEKQNKKIKKYIVENIKNMSKMTSRKIRIEDEYIKKMANFI